MNNTQYQAKQNIKKGKRTAIRILIGCICLVIAIVWFYQESEVDTYNMHASHNKRVARMYHKKAHRLTENQIRLQYDKKEPNLSRLLKNTSQQVNKTVRYGFNIKNKKQYKSKEYIWQQMMGISFSDTLTHILIPNTSSGNTMFAEGNQLLSYKLNYYTLSYGKFDEMENTIPVNLRINFQTPAVPKSDSMGMGRKYHHNGSAEIDGTLFVHSKQIQVNHYYLNISK